MIVFHIHLDDFYKYLKINFINNSIESYTEYIFWIAVQQNVGNNGLTKGKAGLV